MRAGRSAKREKENVGNSWKKSLYANIQVLMHLVYRRIVYISIINSYRSLWREIFTFEAATFIRGACLMERKRSENHRCESTGANFPCGGTKPRLRSGRVRSCRKNALGRSAVLAENSTCRPDGVAGRLNRTISSRTNCLDVRPLC